MHEKRDNLALQVTIAKKWVTFVNTTILGFQKIEGEGMDDRKAYIFMSLADKGFTTFYAILHLLENTNFSDDASALVRVLYECALTAVFLLYSDEQAVDDYADYHLYRLWWEHLQVLAVVPDAEDRIPLADRQQMKANFDSVKDRYEAFGGKWTRMDIGSMARFVGEQLPKGHRVYSSMYEIIFRPCSAFVHSDVRSISNRIKPLDNGTIQIHRVVAEQERARVLQAANYLMASLTFAVSGTFYKAEFIPLWNDIVREWGEFPDEN